MSSTNRGAERRPADYYPTPGWCVRRLLERVHLPLGRWLEPGAGQGHIIRAVTLPVDWVACELRPECSEPLRAAVGTSGRVEICDFLRGDLAARHPEPFDVAIGNPPYGLAMEFIAAALQRARTVAFLLRVAFLASRERQPFFQQNMPSVYVLPDRPSFTGTGTDSADYAWFIWRRDSTPVVQVLDLTPQDQKRSAAMLAKCEAGNRRSPRRYNFAKSV